MRRQGKNESSSVRVADRLHSAAIHLLRRLRSEDAESGLSGPQLSALSVVVFAGPITVSDLAAAEQVRPPTISRLVKALERDGLVERQRDPDDGRVYRLSATARGVRLLKQGRERRVARLARHIARLSPSERRTLERAVGILTALSRPE